MVHHIRDSLTEAQIHLDGDIIYTKDNYSIKQKKKLSETELNELYKKVFEEND